MKHIKGVGDRLKEAEAEVRRLEGEVRERDRRIAELVEGANEG